MIVGTWSRRNLLHGVGAVEIDYYKLIDILRKPFIEFTLSHREWFY